MKDSAKRKFLKSWMRTESSLERAAPPTLISFADMDYWYLAAPLRWQQPGNQGTITVPKGFATDFASIPRVFWSWLPPIGRYGVPAIVHDWHYWNQSTTRDQADDMLEANLVELGVPLWQRWSIMRGVRWGGGKYWNLNAIEKQSGGGRVLAQFPDDTAITWAEWRQRPRVFADPVTVPVITNSVT